MAYLIRRKEPVDAELRRILAEQNRRALGLLRGWQEHPRESVHQARQVFKRIRALLRLLRPGAPYVYRVENSFYRDLGRSLACARDSEAVIDALGLLEGRVSGPLAQDSLRMMRSGLEQRAVRERECEAHDLGGRIEAACAALGIAAKRIRDLPLGQIRRKHLRRGADASIESCVAALDRVRRSGADGDFHAWRKQVKYVLHQARLQRDVRPRRASDSSARLDALAGSLGRHHDLVVLEDLLRRQHDALNIDVHLRSMRNAVRLAKGHFADEALAMGAQIFRRRLPGDNTVVRLGSHA